MTNSVPTFLRIWRLLSGEPQPLHYTEIAHQLGIKPHAAHARLLDLAAGKYPGYSIRALARGTFARVDE